MGAVGQEPVTLGSALIPPEVEATIDRLWLAWMKANAFNATIYELAKELFVEAIEHRTIAEHYDDQARLELANRRVIYLLDLHPELEVLDRQSDPPEPEPELELEPELEPEPEQLEE